MEKWKDIRNYEGIYQVSNFGRVRRWRVKAKTWFYLKPSNHSGGYLRLKLRNSGNDKDAYIHRLVAEAFIQGNGDQVNHKDGDKTNNHHSNLEWCTGFENINHYFSGKGVSKYVGVVYAKKRRKYRARLSYKGVREQVGHFNCETSAYIARLKRMKQLRIKNKYA